MLMSKCIADAVNTAVLYASLVSSSLSRVQSSNKDKDT